MSLRSDLRPAKNASSANRRKSQIFDGVKLHFGTILGAQIDAKSSQKISRKTMTQKIDQKRVQKGSEDHWQPSFGAPGPTGKGGDVNIPTSKTNTRLTEDLTRQWADGPANFYSLIIIHYLLLVAYVAIRRREVSLIVLCCCTWQPLGSTTEVLLYLADLRVLQMKSWKSSVGQNGVQVGAWSPAEQKKQKNCSWQLPRAEALPARHSHSCEAQ